MPPAEEMGRGEERILAQSIQKAPYEVRKESGELYWSNPICLLPDSLSENNFGIGSKCGPTYNLQEGLTTALPIIFP